MKRLVSILLTLFMVFTCFIGTSPAKVSAKTIGTVYYADSAGGNDNNNGLSPKSAWKSLAKVSSITFKPGDKILFKAGSVWNEQLRPHGSGAEGAPIIIDMYGVGEKPIINGQGIIDKEETEFGSHLSSTIMLDDQQYWEINNLEVTNYADSDGNRRAVYVTAGNIGECKHIYFNNMYIHNVRSTYNAITWIGYFTGGIIFQIIGTGDPRGIKDQLKPTYFNDIKVENCTFENLDQSGVFIRNSIHMNRGAISDGLLPWVPNKNVVIRNNSFDHIGGDGLVAAECDGAVLENNVAKNCHDRTAGCYVAIWTINSNNTLLQNNEAYLTHTTLDGKAYDCDTNSIGITYQYNYSHDNEGGFMLICNNTAQFPDRFLQDNTIRYNISQNDKNMIFDYAVAASFNTKVYNNTIYIGKGLTTIPFYKAQNSEVYNNIIYNLGDGGYVYDADTCYFDNNCYFGNKTAGEPQEPHGVYADPKPINAGSGKIGINTLAGYKLKANSPCINAGKVIDNNGGKDFFGNPAPYPGTLPDIGALEYQGKGKSPIGLNNEFDSTSMAKGWSFVREDKANWSLKNRPGYLSITTQPGDLSGSKNSLKNILTQPAKDSNFVVSTKLDFKPGENGQNAGLIIYGDDDNYYTLTRDNLSGAAFIARNESKGTSKTLGRKTDVITSATSYLKIEKNGDIYTSYYSADGSTWTQLAQTSGINIANPKIGVIAGTTKTQTKSINADFDYIHYGIYDPNPSPIIDNFDSSYLDGRWNFIKERTSDWNLKDKPGYMVIKAGPGSLEGIWTNNIRNIMVTSSPAQDFSIEGALDFLPVAEGQQAGIIVYGDDDNYISINRELMDVRKFTVRSEVNGISKLNSSTDDVTSNSEVYYKIVKHNDSYKCYMKTVNSAWYLVGTVSGQKISNPKVGVYVTKTRADNPDISVNVDSFMYQPIVTN